MVDFAHTADAEWSRLAKAHALADNLATRGVPLTLAERLAGVRRCSDETWQLALRRLAERDT